MPIDDTAATTAAHRCTGRGIDVLLNEIALMTGDQRRRTVLADERILVGCDAQSDTGTFHGKATATYYVKRPCLASLRPVTPAGVPIHAISMREAAFVPRLTMHSSFQLQEIAMPPSFGFPAFSPSQRHCCCLPWSNAADKTLLTEDAEGGAAGLYNTIPAPGARRKSAGILVFPKIVQERSFIIVGGSAAKACCSKGQQDGRLLQFR